jgi:glycosyltransferase involved in cell wall biosynthesis
MVEYTQQRPLRIAIDLTPLQPRGENGGVKPFIFEYLGWLGRQRITPVQLVFLTNRNSHADVRPLARFEDELVCIIDHPQGGELRTSAHSPRESARFDAPPDLVAQLKVDVLYCPFSLCTWSCPGIPTLAAVVDVLHRDYPFTLSPGDASYRETVFQEMVRIADRIQGISQHTLSRVAHHYGFPQERMFCSYIAIHHRFRALAQTSSDAPPARPYFFYPANAWKHKNHEVLLLAYGIYRAQSGSADAWDLVLTGHDGEAMQALVRLSETLGLRQHVRFMGHLSNDHYIAVWRNAGILVFPSLHEGFGIPLVEAMAFGLPILSSTAGSLPEVGGDACHYADATKPLALAEAMSHLASSPELRAGLVARGYERLKTFSFEQDARRFLDELTAAARQPAKQTVKGVYTDGWTTPQAFVGLPAWHRSACLHLTLSPMPAARKLKLYHGPDLIGNAHVPAGTTHSMQIAFWPAGGTLILVVPDASQLNQNDHRSHGVLVSSLRLRDPEGVELDLLAP